jgi:C-terminal of Roc, COR, domain/Ras of Complex, Roc, domain of DAPkinase
MVHATHQLFLRESCLYVLVISARNEINATEQAEYWLEHVKTFGKNAPVIIVGNKTDQTSLNLEMATLREKYPNIVNFFSISCTQAQGKFKLQFDLFKQELYQQLQAVGTHQMMFTKAQAEVLGSLRQLQSNKTFLSQAEYLALCNEHGVGDDSIQNREWLLDILDKLGVIIHFPELPFADGYVLNPRWLTYGVYKLMYSARPRLSQKDIVTILGSEKVVNEVGQGLAYPPDKCFLIMEAMKQFKLCYSLPGQPDTLIIPALLAPDAPRFKFDKSNALAFSFVFKGFLPRHVLPELIVVRHENIMQHAVQSYVWQHGVCLQSKTSTARAVLQVDYHLRTLSIWAIGPDARDYLMLLRNDIKEILSRLTIAPDEMITLPASTRITQGRLPMGRADEQADFQQIQAVERLGRNEYISASGSIYDVSKILQRFIPDSARIQHHTVNQSIHIHGTVHGNVTIAKTIEDSFNQLTTSPASEELKQQLKILLQEIQALHAKIPTAQKARITDMLEEAQSLISETARPKPRTKHIGISLDEILEATQALGSSAQQVRDAVTALTPLLPGIQR